MDFLKKPVSMAVAIAILVTTLISTAIYLSRKPETPIARPDSVKVEVERVRRGSLTRTMTVVGTLQALHTVTVKAQVRGLISKVHIQGGEAVEKGDLLFEIDDRSYRAKHKEAKAGLSLAEAQFKRIQKLREKNFGSPKAFEKAQAEYLQAQAKLESAEKDLEDTRIVAPFSGVVGLHNISEGTPITADLDLVKITDVDPIKVRFKMPAKLIPHLSLGQRVELDVDGFSDKALRGEISAIDAQVDPGAQSIAVNAEISNAKNRLKPGMFVRVKVTVGSKDDSLIVPEEAIVASGDQNYVWKVIEHPKRPGMFVVFRVPVSIGIQDKDRVEVMRGVYENDIIVTVGYSKVADGIPVRFDPESVDLEPATKEADKPVEQPAKKADTKEEASKETADKPAAKKAKPKKVGLLNRATKRLQSFFKSSSKPAVKKAVEAPKEAEVAIKEETPAAAKEPAKADTTQAKSTPQTADAEAPTQNADNKKESAQ